MFISVEVLQEVSRTVIINTDKIDMIYPEVKYDEKQERYYEVIVNCRYLKIKEQSYIRLLDLLIDKH